MKKINRWMNVTFILGVCAVSGLVTGCTCMNKDQGTSKKSITYENSYFYGKDGAFDVEKGKDAIIALREFACITVSSEIEFQQYYSGTPPQRFANCVQNLMPDEAAQAATAKSLPIGRIGDPVECANAILFLASDEASFVTGHALVVDGGWTAGRRLSI